MGPVIETAFLFCRLFLSHEMLSETFYFCILKSIKLVMLSMFQHTYYWVTLSEILSDSPLPNRWSSELRAVAERGEGPGQALSRHLGPGSWDLPSLVTG